MTQFNYDSSQFLGVANRIESSEVWLLPVPWEVTTSYGRGAAKGPEHILEASTQLDLEDPDMGAIYKKGLHWLSPRPFILEANEKYAAKSEKLMAQFEEQGEMPATAQNTLAEINKASAKITDFVYKQATFAIRENKKLGIVGGDHSSPLGLIKALSEAHKGEFGILHIDAHADLRKAYQGFKESHASIMYNVITLPKAPQKLVQVGVRDYCKEESQQIDEHSNITCFYDRTLKKGLFSGKTWDHLCQEIINALPNKVYISFDIDGLSPEFCPGTGTPVPGGLSFDQAVHLLVALKESGREIIGFDLCEVAPSPQGQWDGNVGARILYKLCGCL